ncbi:TetR/AcrR family transcriptional regulator [Cecembia lonarensis]|uniref:DNA-binding transcriptional repressor AcrR n=1 Tax=Cecembia lonarensis (strain CCUG 58316 / KCTC 22772 / LW9) TaxID=1225176 RepID=K1LYZ6_CECL9|nr:TetR/AcrR family transcriptional regulator [Cecembia lonarensis]EKB49319.1 DNA-binding transcriptional repressor AcrR [Cecembia lonarensis LW9]
MSKTKDRILEAAISTFNEHGVANVRLQQIADAADISVGNLAYHFKNKEAIVSHVYDFIFSEFSEILSDYLFIENFQGLDRNLEQYYAFFMKYRFFFTDMFEIERNYPDILEKWHKYSNRMLLQVKSRIEFDVQRGVLVPQSDEMNELLSSNIWMSIIFWLPQRILRGLPAEEKLFKEAVWSQMTPYLTDRGEEEFVAYIYPVLI